MPQPHDKKIGIYPRMPERVVSARTLIIFLAVLLTLAIPSLLAFRQYKISLMNESKQAVTRAVLAYRDVLAVQLSERLGHLSGLTAFVLSNPAPSELNKEFDSFAQGLVARDPGIRAVEIAPNAVIAYIYPRQGNEAALGADLLHDKRQAVQEDVKLGIATKRTIVGGPYELLQGGRGFVAREPIFNPDGSFYGTTQIVFNVAQLVKETGLDSRASQYDLALRSRSGEILYEKAHVFSGSPIVRRIYIPGGFWEVAAIPKGGWVAAVTAAQNEALFSGTAIVLLLTIIVTGVLDRQRYLGEAVAYRTMELEHAASFPRQNPNPIVEFDKAGALIFNNDAATQTLQQAGVAGQFDLFKPADYDSSVTATARRRKAPTLYREVKIGEHFFGETIVPSDEELGVRIYTIDITDKKTYEAELVERQNQLVASYKDLDRSLTMYAVLSDINENSLRIADRKRLSAAVCETLVKQAGYKWVAVLMRDGKSGTFKTSAWQGSPADFASSLDRYLDNLTDDDPVLGDLIGKAKSVVCTNLSDEKVTQEWREMNARAGFAISGAFPLVKDRAIVGAIIAFSGDPGL